MADEKKYFEPGKIGESSWETTIKKTIDWGVNNKIRILGDFETFYIHWLKIGDRWKMQKCVDDCELCKQNVRRTPRYNVIALDKTDNIVKKVEIGAQLFQQICSLVRDGNEIGSCDFVIKKENSGNFPTYRVFVEDSGPLDIESQLSIIEYENEEIPVGNMALDLDICPKHQVKGVITGNKCMCPICFHVIWGN